MTGEIRAAGGVVRRATGEVLVVHRPKYDDWTFPKGKADPGESDEDCARREVEEETGLQCRLGDELPSTHYLDHHDRPKVVRYWAMEIIGGEFTPNREVDEIAWLLPDAAADLLTYEHDVTVLRSLVGGGQTSG